jgi:hypothetical protein
VCEPGSNPAKASSAHANRARPRSTMLP